MLQIQPYFPEPIVVSKNVATERYIVRLSFVRAVLAGHSLSVVAIAAIAILYEPTLAITTQWILLFACLLALTFVRRFLNGRSLDGVLSFFLLLPTLFSLGCLASTLTESGAPVWILGLGYLICSVYGALCGRDYSFVGQFVITTIVLSTILVVTVLFRVVYWEDALFWEFITLSYIFFFIYDLAALLSRRRLGEEPAAVADLYRDLLNFSTYSVRIFLHWKRFGPI